MANIVVKLPWGNPLSPPLITLVDNGDGTHSPKISAAGITTGTGTAQIGGNGATNGKKGAAFIVSDATTAADGKAQIQTAGTFGSTGQILQSDGTYATWSVSIAANVSTGGTVADIVTALINAGLMASA